MYIDILEKINKAIFLQRFPVQLFSMFLRKQAQPLDCVHSSEGLQSIQFFCKTYYQTYIR